MTVTHKINAMDLTVRGITPRISVKQGDKNSRAVEIPLLEAGKAWTIPAGVTAIVRYRKRDGTAGLYDTMPDGTTTAVTYTGNVLTVNIAPQMLTCHGLTRCDVVLISGAEVLATFDFHLAVEPSPVDNATLESQDYYKVSSLAQINAALEGKLEKSGDTMTGPLDMGGNSITGADSVNAAALAVTPLGSDPDAGGYLAAGKSELGDDGLPVRIMELYGNAGDEPVVLRHLGTPRKDSDAANKAYVDAAAGSGSAGADGGYYTPAVDGSGNLTWVASKSDMPAVAGANIKGPHGKTGAAGRGITSIARTSGTGAAGTKDTYTITFTDNTKTTFQVYNGADGKSAYQYAQDGGYTGTEAEFAEKLAEEIPAVDATLTQEGKAADAKATGDAIRALSEEIANKAANVYIGPVQPTDGTLYWLDTSDSGGSGGETVTHTVTATLTNVTIDNTAESVNEGTSFAAALTASVGYELSSVKITMGGVDITNTAYANGNIYISAVTGDVVITAVAVEVSEVTTYTITNNLVNVTSNNSAVSAEENASYTATLTPATDYALGSVTVTMGGVDVTADVYADGVINIPAVTGDVVITTTGIYAPTSPVFELAEPYTGTGSESTVLDYNIVDEDKTFSVAIDFSATPATGIYVFGAGSENNSLGIRGQGGYYWFAQSQYYKTAEIANGKVTNKKVVLTYEKGSGNLLVHHVKTDGTKEIVTLAKGWATGGSANTQLNPNGTVNDLKIYLRVLEEAEINEYLGVV